MRANEGATNDKMTKDQADREGGSLLSLALLGLLAGALAIFRLPLGEADRLRDGLIAWPASAALKHTTCASKAAR